MNGTPLDNRDVLFVKHWQNSACVAEVADKVDYSSAECQEVANWMRSEGVRLKPMQDEQEVGEEELDVAAINASPYVRG